MKVRDGRSRRAMIRHYIVQAINARKEAMEINGEKTWDFAFERFEVVRCVAFTHYHLPDGNEGSLYCWATKNRDEASRKARECAKAKV